MNRQLLHDPLLRYASLAGAGLPVGERHLARSAARQRIARVEMPSPAAAPAEDVTLADDATSGLVELTFTVTIGDGAPAIVFDGDASTAPGGTKTGRKSRRLTLLSY